MRMKLPPVTMRTRKLSISGFMNPSTVVVVVVLLVVVVVSVVVVVVVLVVVVVVVVVVVTCISIDSTLLHGLYSP